MRYITFLTITLFFLLCVISSSTQALTTDKANKNKRWKLWKENRNLHIEYRKIQQQNLIEIHASATVTSTLPAALLFLQDTSIIPYWLENASKSEILIKLSEQENISKTTFNAFWPIKQREMIIRSRYWQNNDLSVEVVIEDETKNYQQYATSNTIPITIISAYWKINSADNNTITIEHTIIANPNGSIPNWLANRIALNAMWQTLLNIEEQLPSSNYQQQHLSTIK